MEITQYRAFTPKSRQLLRRCHTTVVLRLCLHGRSLLRLNDVEAGPTRRDRALSRTKDRLAYPFDF
jgi:hypothetical protein